MRKKLVELNNGVHVSETALGDVLLALMDLADRGTAGFLDMSDLLQIARDNPRRRTPKFSTLAFQKAGFLNEEGIMPEETRHIVLCAVAENGGVLRSPTADAVQSKPFRTHDNYLQGLRERWTSSPGFV